jgi:hypothetical protein
LGYEQPNCRGLFIHSEAGNYQKSLPELDLSHIYLHWDLGGTSYGYVCEMMTDKETNYFKEYPLDSMKVSGIVSCKKGVRI